MTRSAVAGLAICLVIAIPAVANAQSAVQPIVVGEAKDQLGCFIYLKADGSRLLFQAKPIMARGDCPEGDFLRGSVERFGAESYRLRIPSQNADCVITAEGLGRCQPGVIDDRPKAEPPATQPTKTAPPAQAPQDVPAEPSQSTTQPLPKGD
jgi:hypothetical protein